MRTKQATCFSKMSSEWFECYESFVYALVHISDVILSEFFPKNCFYRKNAPILINCSYIKRPIGAQFCVVVDKIIRK